MSELGKIFGAYTEIPWKKGDDCFKPGNGNSFIYSLRDDSNFVKLRCLDIDYELVHRPDCICDFGNADGFLISNNCNIYLSC